MPWWFTHPIQQWNSIDFSHSSFRLKCMQQLGTLYVPRVIPPTVRWGASALWCQQITSILVVWSWLMCGQSHLTLCKPMGCIVLGFSVHWLYASSPLLDLSSWPRDWTYVSCISRIGRQIIYQLCHLGSTLGLWLYLYSFQDPHLYDGKSSISPHGVGMK